jgi:hypothetical protein
VVQEYFAAINAQDYARAWSLGGMNLGGSFDSFAKGLIQLDATQTDGTHRFYAGTYVVQNGEIVSADVHTL